MKNKKDINNERLELLINEAMQDIQQRDMIDKIEDKNVVFSKKHERNIKKIISKYKNKCLINDCLTYAKKGVAVFIITILLLFAITFSVEAFRVSFLNYFLEKKEKYLEITLKKENQYIEEKLQVLFLPENFILQKRDVNEEGMYLKFVNNDNYIIISIEKNEGIMQLDDEDSVTEYENIKGNGVLFIKKEDRIIAFWKDNEYVYIIYGNVEKDDIKKVVYNLSFNT